MVQIGGGRVKLGYSVVHGIAACDDCGWQTDSYKNAQAIAAIHARAHGHRVHGEIGCVYIYDGRQEAVE